MSAEQLLGPGGAPSTATIVARMRDKQQELELLVGRLRRANEALRDENARLRAERDALRCAANLASAALGWIAHPDGHKTLGQARAYAATSRDDHAALVPAVTELSRHPAGRALKAAARPQPPSQGRAASDLAGGRIPSDGEHPAGASEERGAGTEGEAGPAPLDSLPGGDA